MKIGSPKRVRKEDFKPEFSEVVEGIGNLVNDFNDQVYQTLTNGVDFNNLTQQLVTLDLTTGPTGLLINPPQIKYNIIRAKYQGCWVINAQNLNNSNIYPTSAPSLQTTINGNLVTILNQTGLPPNSQFRLTLILIGG